VTTPFRVSALTPPRGLLWAGEHRLKFIRVFIWAQMVMVVTNLGRIPVLSTEDRDFPIAINELALGAMLVAAAFCVQSWQTVRLDRPALVALLFAAVGGTSALFSINRFDMTTIELIISLSYLGRWLAYFTLYVALINVVKLDGVETLWGAVENMLVLLGAFGIVQSAFLPRFAQMVYENTRSFNLDEQGRRLVSTVLEPNLAGTMLMIGTLVHAARIATGATVNRWKMTIVFAALVLTISRSAAVGLIFGTIVIFVARGISRRLMRVIIFASAVGVLVSPLLIQYLIAYNKFSIGENSSAAARVSGWIDTLRVISQYPFFGVGFNAYRYAVEHNGGKVLGASSYGADGGLLFIMAMTGIVGLTLYCGMLGLIIARCRAIWRDESIRAEHRGLAIGTAAATVGVVFASTFINALLTTFVMEMLWVLWAASFVIAASGERRQNPRSAKTVVRADG
jgi:O-antigen ligase